MRGVSSDPRASQRWYPDGRTLQLWVGATLVAQGLLQTLFNADEGDTWSLVFFLSLVPLGAAQVLLARLTRVEATSDGLRIVRPPSKQRVVPWRDVDDIRRDPPNSWATKLVIVHQDGDVISLPLPINVHRELIERWKLETA